LGYGNDSDYTQPATLGLVTAYVALPLERLKVYFR
jgi:hypothetical protein